MDMKVSDERAENCNKCYTGAFMHDSKIRILGVSTMGKGIVGEDTTGV